jgi:hypothetical protein
MMLGNRQLLGGFFVNDWVEAGANEVGLRTAQRFSVGKWTHQNAGEVFGSRSQLDGKALVSKNPGKSFRLRLGNRHNLPIGLRS